MYYIDRRTPGRNEDFLIRVASMEGVDLVKGKVGKIDKGDNGRLVLKLENVAETKLIEATADLVVLATGMVSNLTDGDLPLDFKKDEDGFGIEDPDAKIFVAGVARRPEDVASSVRDATGAAAKALVAGRSS
jgi:quinone-modifying oxidoreductase subunit QmoA